MKFLDSEHTVVLRIIAELACVPAKEPGKVNRYTKEQMNVDRRHKLLALAEIDAFLSGLGRYNGWKVATRRTVELGPGVHHLILEAGVDSHRGLKYDLLAQEFWNEIQELIRVRARLIDSILDGYDSKILEGKIAALGVREIITPSFRVYNFLKKRLPKEAGPGEGRREEVNLHAESFGAFVYPGQPDTSVYSTPDAGPPETIRGKIKVLSEIGNAHCRIKRDPGRGFATALIEPWHFDELATIMKEKRARKFKCVPKRWTLGGFLRTDIYALESIIG